MAEKVGVPTAGYDADKIAKEWVTQGYEKANVLFNDICVARNLVNYEVLVLRDKVAQRKLILDAVV